MQIRPYLIKNALNCIRFKDKIRLCDKARPKIFFSFRFHLRWENDYRDVYGHLLLFCHLSECSFLLLNLKGLHATRVKHHHATNAVEQPIHLPTSFITESYLIKLLKTELLHNHIYRMI